MGGGAVRTAAKVAGITVAHGGLRGITSEHYPVFSATRRATASCPAAAAEGDAKLVASQSMASSEMDEWVFAEGAEEGTVCFDQMPRVFFRGPPTLQEAKEAASELAVALEKAYLSSTDSIGNGGSFVSDYDSSSSISSSQVIENEACVGSEISSAAPSVPANAIKAFRLLHESSVAQNVVASIACDPNVWSAVLHNQELQEFLQSQRTCLACSNVKQKSSDHTQSRPDGGFVDMVQKVKISVVDMMSSLSDYFQNLFGGQGTNRVSPNSDGSASANAETVMEASFMGLAVMAIMVILLKRV